MSVFSQKDLAAVREAAAQVMEIAALPVQKETRDMWARLNRLDPVRPMVWINEIPWWELRCDELTPKAENEFARNVESQLRTTLYLWNHMRTDMVVEPCFYTRYAFSDSGWGMSGSTTVSEGGEYGRGSHDYIPVMKTDEDIERIQMPTITPDWEATDEVHTMASELLGDVMPVVKRGVTCEWCAAWDVLIQWYGIEEMYVDMYDRPDFVSRVASRMIDAYIHRHEQFESLGLLSAGEYNHRVGSGGLGITDELPQDDCPDPNHCRPVDQWGSCTGQIMSEVSPDMHWEFCLRHEMRYLERFGLNCYGCCEPLDVKMGILRKVPRLRRISMSTWIDPERAAGELQRDYIFSYKPNPSVVAWDDWSPRQARDDLRRVLDIAKDCCVELIFKDITTCRNEPARLWEWCDLAVETAKEYA